MRSLSIILLSLSINIVAALQLPNLPNKVENENGNLVEKAIETKTGVKYETTKEIEKDILSLNRIDWLEYKKIIKRVETNIEELYKPQQGTPLVKETTKKLEGFYQNRNPNFLGANITQKLNQMKQQVSQNFTNRQDTNNVSKQSNTKWIEGYCFFDRRIIVFGNQKIPITIYCAFTGTKSFGKLQGTLEPDLKNYSLLFKPEYVVLEKKVYKVVKGYVLNGSRTNTNIASVINVPNVKKILANTAIDTADTASKMIQDAVSQQQQQVKVNGDVVIQQRSVDFSTIGEGIVWSALASLVKNTASVIKDNLSNIPMTFEIYQGTKIYVNLEIKPLQYDQSVNTINTLNLPYGIK